MIRGDSRRKAMEKLQNKLQKEKVDASPVKKFLIFFKEKI